ncbi:MAG TPA: hypothetical protein VEC35_02455 [Noviherbaspirillum sp.]|nr:hypothetical protein [Noviherbaspirillum sp.]
MKKLFCLIGIVVIFLDSLIWATSSATNRIGHMTAIEFGVILLIGILLMLPELIFQFREFISSGAPDDAPF